MRTKKTLVGMAAVLGLSGLGLLGPAGCSSYANINENEGVVAVNNPNARVPSEVAREAIRYVVTRYQAGGPYAVNLAPRTNEAMADFIVRDLPGPWNLVSEDNGDLPTYFLGSMRIRGNTAMVDVFRPVVERGELPGGGYAQQAVTVHMDGGLNPWKVTRIQRWAVGAIQVPERYVVGAAAEAVIVDNADEAVAEPVAEETASVDESVTEQP